MLASEQANAGVYLQMALPLFFLIKTHRLCAVLILIMKRGNKSHVYAGYNLISFSVCKSINLEHVSMSAEVNDSFL